MLDPSLQDICMVYVNLVILGKLTVTYWTLIMSLLKRPKKLSNI
jgi:hypothetical protein